jgi:hypothetical protein
MDLRQAQEQQQPEPDPSGDRLEIQADAEEEDQYGAERLMSPEVTKHCLIRQSAAISRVTARVWIADWGYQPLRKDFGRLELTGLFRLLLSGDPGPVENLTGEFSQFSGRAGLIALDDEESGMEQDHQLPNSLSLAVSGRHQFSHLSSHDRSVTIQDLHKASGHCISFPTGRKGVLLFDRLPPLIGSATAPEGLITQA